MSSNIRELGAKSLFSFSLKIIGQIVNFISVIIIARLLGAEIYGEYIYILSFLSILTIVPYFGLPNAIVYFLSRKSISIEEKKSILSFSLLISLFISIVVVFGGYVIENVVSIKILNISGNSVFNILLPSIILTVMLGILTNALRAMRKIKVFTIFENLITPLLKLLIILVFVFVFKNTDNDSLIVSFYLTSIITLIYYIYELKKIDLIGKIIWKNNNLRIIKYAFPLMFSGIISMLMQNVDIYMIGYMTNEINVGIYRIAIQFGTISSIALISVNTIFAPLISNLFHDNKLNELEDIYKRSTRWITMINLLIFGFIASFSKGVMNLAGDDFVVGAAALVIISFGQVINSIVGSVGYINSMSGHPEYELISGIFALIINLILNYFLIPIYGIDGAAIATSISLATKNISNFVLMYKTLNMQPYDFRYFYMFIIVGFSIITAYVLSKVMILNWLLELIICGFVYFSIYILLIYKFVFDNGELKLVRNLFRKVV